MEFEGRGLYNLLRVRWLDDPSLDVEEWQVADYRSFSEEEIFSSLANKGIVLDRGSFLAYAESVDSPEELTSFLTDEDCGQEEYDYLYLHLFELWRRFLPRPLTVSVLCDELDQQISAFENEELEEPELLSELLLMLQEILEDSTDEGLEPVEVFQIVTRNCAHDIESFLYDFISEQVDGENTSYAQELVEGFESYISNKRWFSFLRARIIAHTDPDEANTLVLELLDGYEGTPNLDFLIDMMVFMVSTAKYDVFIRLVKQALPLLTTVEEFAELVDVSATFYSFLDNDEKESALQKLYQHCETRDPDDAISLHDRDVTMFLDILDIAKSLDCLTLSGND